MNFGWGKEYFKKKIHWLNKVHYIAGFLLILAFISWFIIASQFYKESSTRAPTSGDIGIILYGVVIQLGTSFLIAIVVRKYLPNKLPKDFISQINEEKLLSEKPESVEGFICQISEKFQKIFWPNSKETEDVWPKEGIKKLLSDKDALKMLERDKRDDVPCLLDELDKLIDKTKEMKQEIHWDDVAKLLYQVARLCKELKRSDLEQSVKKPYDIARDIIYSNCFINYFHILVPLFSFTMVFLFFSMVSTSLFGPRVGSDWVNPVLFLVMGILIASILFIWFQFWIRWFTEKTWNNLDDIIVGILSVPASAVIIGWAAYKSFKSLPEYFMHYSNKMWGVITQDKIISIFVIILATWVVVFIFDRVIIHILRRWAEKTEQKYDDMFVRILQVYGEFLIIAVALAVILVKFQPELREATGVDNILLPYAIIVSVFSAILGYASRESLENFFGGVLLQIDKPFEKGERLVLETGEICEVRDIGMRSTVLYNVLENTEISIPNSVMVSQKITNTSRPDWELRIPIKMGIPHDSYSLWRAEMILLDIAYIDGEIDQARISEDELTQELKERKREPITEKLCSLVKTYPLIKTAAISQIIGGGTARRERIFAIDLTKGAKQFKQDENPKENFEKVKNILKKQYKGIELSGTENKQMDELLLSLDDGEGEIFRRLARITQLRTKYAKQLEDTRKEISQLIVGVACLDAGFTYVQLQRLIEEVIYRLVHDVDSAQVSNDMLQDILTELSQREIIFQGTKHDDTKERITKSVDFIRQTLIGLASKIALNNGEKHPKDIEAIKSLSKYFDYKERVRLGLLAAIHEELTWVADALFTIGDTYRKDVRKEMDVLVAELGKEPTVHSQFVVTEDGRGYVAIDFNVYATHLERRFEVINKLNREIQRRFRVARINMWDLGNDAFLSTKPKHQSSFQKGRN